MAKRNSQQLYNHSDKPVTTIPDRHFLKWLHEESSIARLKIWADLFKEALPYLTAVIIFIITVFVKPEMLIIVAPSLAGLIKWATKRDP